MGVFVCVTERERGGGGVGGGEDLRTSTRGRASDDGEPRKT